MGLDKRSQTSASTGSTPGGTLSDVHTGSFRSSGTISSRPPRSQAQASISEGSKYDGNGDWTSKRVSIGRKTWLRGIVGDHDKKGFQLDRGSPSSGKVISAKVTRTKAPQKLPPNVDSIQEITVLDRHGSTEKTGHTTITNYKNTKRPPRTSLFQSFFGSSRHHHSHSQDKRRNLDDSTDDKGLRRYSRKHRYESELTVSSGTQPPRSVSSSILNGTHQSIYSPENYQLPVRPRNPTKMHPSTAARTVTSSLSSSKVRAANGSAPGIYAIHRASHEALTGDASTESDNKISSQASGSLEPHEGHIFEAQEESIPDQDLLPTLQPLIVDDKSIEHKIFKREGMQKGRSTRSRGDHREKEPISPHSLPDKSSRRGDDQRESSDQGTPSQEKTDTKSSHRSSHKPHHSSHRKHSTRRPSDGGERSQRQTSEKGSGKTRPRARSPDELFSRPTARKHSHHAHRSHRRAPDDTSDRTHDKSSASVLLDAISEDEQSDQQTRESYRRAELSDSHTSGPPSTERASPLEATFVERSIDQRTTRHKGLKHDQKSRRKSGFMGWSWT